MCIDNGTDLPLTTSLSAPPLSTTINYLTTLVVEAMKTGMSEEEAEAQVKTNLGLQSKTNSTRKLLMVPSSLKNLDLVSNLKANVTAEALSIYARNSQVSTFLQQAAALVSGQTPSSSNFNSNSLLDASSEATRQLVSQLLSSDSQVRMDNSSVLESLFKAVSQSVAESNHSLDSLKAAADATALVTNDIALVEASGKTDADSIIGSVMSYEKTAKAFLAPGMARLGSKNTTVTSFQQEYNTQTIKAYYIDVCASSGASCSDISPPPPSPPPTLPPPISSSDDDTPLGMIIGIVIGGVLFILMGICGCIVMKGRKNKGYSLSTAVVV